MQRNTGKTFGDMIQHLKNYGEASREGWNGKGMYLALQEPDENSFMTEPYIYMVTATGSRIPWLASQADVLAEDWVLFE